VSGGLCPAAHRSLQFTTNSVRPAHHECSETKHSPSHLNCAGGPAAAARADLAVAIGEDARPDGGGVAVRAAGRGGAGRVVRDVLEVVGSDHAQGVPFRRRLVARGVRPVRPNVVDAALGVLGHLGHRPDIVADLVEAREVSVIDEDRRRAAGAGDELGREEQVVRQRDALGLAADAEEVAGGGIVSTWTVVTGSSQTIAKAHGYISNNAGLITYTLPSTAAVGDRFVITSINATGSWTIVENASQTIKFGTVDTTVTTGSLSSSAKGDTVDIICTVANTNFIVLSSVGNITYV